MAILDNKISLFVPSTGEFGRDITDLEFSRRINEVSEKFAKIFGGATTILGQGKGPDSTRKLVDEKIGIVYSVMNKKQFGDHYQSIVSMGKRLGEQWFQASVLIEAFQDGKYFSELVDVDAKKSSVLSVKNGWHSTEPLRPKQ